MHSFKKSFDMSMVFRNRRIQVSRVKDIIRIIINLSFKLLECRFSSFGGYSQGSYKLDGDVWDGTNQNAMSFSASYSYYPNLDFRITPSLKWILPSDNFGTNTTGQ